MRTVAALRGSIPPLVYGLSWTICHIPGRTAVSVTLGAVNDSGFVSERLRALPDFCVFAGLEELSFPMLAIGAVLERSGLFDGAGLQHASAGSA